MGRGGKGSFFSGLLRFYSLPTEMLVNGKRPAEGQVGMGVGVVLQGTDVGG